MQRLRRDLAAEGGRLFRVLFLWLGSMPADPGRAFGWNGCGFLLSRIAIMANDIVQSSDDWLRSPHTNLLAWWIPQAAIFVGLFAPVNVRTAIWIIALSWFSTQSGADAPTATNRALTISRWSCR
jgi:hypothetical protein